MSINTQIAATLLAATCALPAHSRVETIWTTGDKAPETGGLFFDTFNSPTINDAGQFTVLANLQLGGSVTTDNDRGIWRDDTLIAREGNPAHETPPGVIFSNITGGNPPPMNNSGQIPYYATLSGTGIIPKNDDGIWLNSKLVARAGDTAPDTPSGVTFDSFGIAPIANNAGQTLFRGVLTGTGITLDNNRGLWLDNNLIAREGDTAPGTFSGETFAVFGSVALNNAGQVAYTANLTGPGISADNNEGLWLNDTLIARKGNSAPDTPAGVDYGSFDVFPGPGINDNGQVAYKTNLTGTGIDPTNDSAIFRDGTLVAREGAQAPGTPIGTNFSGFDAPIINGAGNVAFKANVIGPESSPTNREGLWRDDTLIALTGEPAPDTPPGVLFEFFLRPTINRAGLMAFYAFLNGSGTDSSNNDGIFLSDGIDQVMIARTGDAFAGKTIDLVLIHDHTGAEDGFPTSLNNLGQLAYTIRFTDDTSKALLFTPELQWRRNDPAGSWDDKDNWTLSTLPAIVHETTIAPNTNINITSPANNTSVKSLTIGGGLGQATVSIDSVRLFTPTNLHIDRNGHLRIENGAMLRPNGINLGITPTTPPDQPATLTISGSTSDVDVSPPTNVGLTGQAHLHLTNNATGLLGLLNVGIDSDGQVSVDNGANLHLDDRLTLGANPGATGSLNIHGPGSTVTTTSNLIVGNNGNAHLNATSGATINHNNIQLAQNSGSTANLNAQGPGTIISGTFADIGSAGHATLTIQQGAAFTATSGTIIADSGSGTGIVNVTDHGSTYTTSSLTAGFDGHATINVENGGTFNANTAFLALFSGSTAHATITDPGSTMNINGTLGLGISDGIATLNIRNGGTLNVTDTTTIDAPSTINIDGGTFNAATFAGTGQVNLISGTLHIPTASPLLIKTPTFDSNLTLNTHATISSNNNINIDSSVTLNINGGTVSATHLFNDSRINLTAGTIAATATITNFNDLNLGSTTAAMIDTPTFNNDGTLSGPGTFTGNLGNTGRINLTGQTLRAFGSFTNSPNALVIGNGTLHANQIINASNATLAFSGPTNILGDVDNRNAPFGGTPFGTIVSSGPGPLTFFDDVNNNGEIRTNTGGFTVFLGTTSGGGIYTGTGTVVYEADFTPGSSPGINSFGGNLTFGPFASLELEAQATVTSPVAGTDHDQLTIANTLTLDGTLNVVPLPDAGPIQDTPLGNNYLAITYGTRTPASFFHTINGTLINTDFALAPLLDDTTKTFTLRATIPGDLNLDNKVSVADLAEFALNFDTTPGLYNETTNQNSWQLGDFNTDGQITVADLSLLALNFGFDATDPSSTPLGLTPTQLLATLPGITGIDPSTIPEPTTIALIPLAALACTRRRPHHTKTTNPCQSKPPGK